MVLVITTLPMIKHLATTTIVVRLSRSVRYKLSKHAWYRNVNLLPFPEVLLKTSVRIDLPPVDKLYWGTLAPQAVRILT